jgi:hypothetical protein
LTAFNKWFPDRASAERKGATPVTRAWLLRGAWYVSTLMLVAGYVLLFVYWSR